MMSRFWKTLFFIQLAIVISALLACHHYSDTGFSWRVPIFFALSIPASLALISIGDFITGGEEIGCFFFGHWRQFLNCVLAIFWWWFLNFELQIQLVSNSSVQILLPILTFPFWMVLAFLLAPKGDA